MTFTQDFSACFGSAVGGGSPIAQADYDAALAATADIVHALQLQAVDSPPSLLALPERRDDLEALDSVAARWRTAFDTVVVLGAGGSSLGGRALYALKACPVGVGAGGKASAPRILFLDNSDPHTFELAMQRLDLAKTGFVVISKSGGTAETLAQAAIAWRVLIDRLDDSKVRRHFLVLTEAKDSPLRGFAEKREIAILDHPDDLGGRYSCLSLVGLLPAMMGGVDAAAVRAGAERALHDLTGAGAANASIAAAGAAGKKPPKRRPSST